jgi:hypothetical protein
MEREVRYCATGDGVRSAYTVAGPRKCFAHPSLRRLATIRGVDKRSVRRHLAELEQVHLITRQARSGKPNILVIEDPSVKETDLYLRTFDGSGEDRVVRPTPDKIVRPYKKEEEPEERQNLVNEEQALSEVGEGRPAEHISHTVRELTLSFDVKRSASRKGNTKREYMAQEMLAVLGDSHSLGFYRRVALVCTPGQIYPLLAEVKEAAAARQIKRTKGAMFTALVRPILAKEERT